MYFICITVIHFKPQHMKKASKLSDIKVGNVYPIASIKKIEDENPDYFISWYQVGSKGCKVTRIDNLNK